MKPRGTGKKPGQAGRAQGEQPLSLRAVTPKKQYGQNFIINPGVCPKFVDACGIDERFGVIEVGPGLGALTLELAKTGARVTAVEIDRDVIPTLRENTAPYPNVEILEGDILQQDVAALIAERFAGRPVAVVGNLPYYITSPILMKLLEDKLPIQFVAAMVQKEAAQRLCAPEGSRESGAVTLAVRYYSEPHMLFDVSPGSFWPPPSVMSTVIRLDVLPVPRVSPKDEAGMFRVIKAAFSQRRKTAVNAVSAGLGLSKEQTAEAFRAAALPPDIRPERLTLADFCALSDLLFPGNDS